jgi:hypothetical protein
VTARHLRAADVLELYEQTTGGDPDGLIPWGLGPAIPGDLEEAVVRANAAGDLRRPDEPWSQTEANVIRDYMVGLVGARRPLYRVVMVAEFNRDEEIIQDRARLALVYDEDGVADNWQAALAKFRRDSNAMARVLPRVEGMGPTTVSRTAARLSMNKRSLQRRRRVLKAYGIDPDMG